MKKGTFRQPTVLLATLGLLLLGSASHAQVVFYEDFNSFLPTGWTTQNNSVQPQTPWISANRTTVIPGLSQAYAVANFGSTAVTTPTGGNISNWLITPNINLRDGDILSFYTASAGQGFADRLQVRWSATGTNTGSIWSDVGDFSTLLLDINPTLIPTGYPQVWTNLSTIISGVGANYSSGFLAFRYFVTDGGTNGNNSNGVGIDGVQLVSAPEPGTAALALLALPGALLLRRRKSA